ncbi:MAG: hypothetical protein KF833_22045 [Verrucomicrobiae bacterium]|nr:hypothetical protein [Verrucomicrobiae bacterium]
MLHRLKPASHAALAAAALAAAALALAPTAAMASVLLVDFGSTEHATVPGDAGQPLYWNNVTPSVGANDFGWLPDLIRTDGEFTTVSLEMVARFNGANENGTLASGLYASTATRDSLYGNTESFNGLEDIYPSFKLTGLNPGATHDLTFYASRLGVSDNRQTRYTVTGATEATVELDAGNNVDRTVTVTGMAADAAGEIAISLTPGPDNNNANHFTYLGVLDVRLPDGARLLLDFGGGGWPTEFEEPAPEIAWNNLDTPIGTSDTGELASLITTNGTVTSMGLQMLARFNGANLNGSLDATVFPASATRDSLFGNTEAFNGLENVFPAFKFTGLDPAFHYSFTFYASRTGVGDRRETRYTVTGATSVTADLDASNNIDATVRVDDIAPDASGEIRISLAPGPDNNNANHFTYLGALRVEYTPILSPRVLIDFGAAGAPTTLGTDDPFQQWNNVSGAIGSTDTGSLAGLVMTDGTVTPFGLQMVSRFNGVNENGTLTHPDFPPSATRDSLFGNTEPFSGLENVTPIFQLTGLDPQTDYHLTFYASRLGVGDNRETRYTVTGATEAIADLDVANNEDQAAVVTGLRPNAAGAFTIALTPGPNNDNGNHFTYLGILQLDWTARPPSTPPSLSALSRSNTTVTFELHGTPGATYLIQRSATLGAAWSDGPQVTLDGPSRTVEIESTDAAQFFQARLP